MFSFLKRLRKAEQAPLQTVSIAELPKWLEAKIEQQKHAAHQAFEAQLPALREQVGMLGSSIAALQAAELMNPNIPERAKQVMDGNRSAFIRPLEQFIHELTLPASLDDVPRFQQQVMTAIQLLLPSLNRPFQVLQEFFSNESKDVINGLHLVEKTTLAMAQLRATHQLDALEDARQALVEFNAGQTREQNAKEALANAQRDAQMLDKDIARMQTEIGALEQGHEHQLLLDVKNKLQKTTSALKDVRAKMSEQFSAIEPALKKYERVSLHNPQLIRDYLANPIETLARDRDLVILHVLASMRREVMSESIDLKDRKKEKVLAAMDTLSRETLSEFLKQYSALLQQQNALVSQADQMPVLHKLAFVRKQLQSMQEQKQRLSQVKATVATPTTDSLREQMQKLGVELR
jgi:hypothetical protein